MLKVVASAPDAIWIRCHRFANGHEDQCGCVPRRIVTLYANVKAQSARPRMNPHEHELTYPWADVPAPGTLITLRPGVHWLRMPLPFALDHINLWLLDDEIDGRAGFTTIDCGITSEPTKSAWEQIFDDGVRGQAAAARAAHTFIRITSGWRTG